MLAAAGIAGVILIAVPLLVMAGNERDKHSEEHTTVAADSRTLNDQQEAQQPPDVYVAESPKDDSPAAASKDGDGGKEGKTAKDGGKTLPDGSPFSSSVAADGASPPSASQKKESAAKAPAQPARKTVDKPVRIASARIVSADTGKCLTATSRGVGSELVVQPCGASEGAQVWAFHTADQTLRIGQDLCMGLDGGSVNNGTAIRLQQCNGSAGQKFRINATEDLVSLKAGNKCADVWWGEGANGTPVKLWPCTGTANQTWRRG
ncbi:RICIN domain-containing protein [Streptomyces sp. NPDC006622]|uniref:RICIN domain-containing protein n=1 Tax=Streptomyces sp. NPDC006622 TaxID=3155459 RepID=UPI0033B92558